MSLIPHSQDAYGAEMLAYYHDSSAVPYELVERDDGYIGFSRGPASYFSPERDWPEYERAALAAVRGRVLDIGCGAGKHSLALKQRGHHVLPIDNSPGAVEVARLRGLEEVQLAGIEDVDPRFGNIDTILLMGNNFGLFSSREKSRVLLRRFAELTGPGARIVAESSDPHVTEDPDHLQYHERNRAAGRMPGQLRIRIRYRRLIGPWFDYLLVSPAEMAELAGAARWHLAQRIDGPRGVFVGVLEKG